jgi:hypothetical protein
MAATGPACPGSRWFSPYREYWVKAADLPGLRAARWSGILRPFHSKHSETRMGVMERFFGHRDQSARLGEQLVANPVAAEKVVSLQVLFPEPIRLESENIKAWLRAYDSELRHAQCEIDPTTANQGTPLGLVGWRNHVIQFLGFPAPYPAEDVEKALSALHVNEEMKDAARAHQATVILYYAGYEESVLEQYVALAAVAGALTGLGASIVLNTGAHTSLPAGVLALESSAGRRTEILRVLPLHLFYCGCVIYWVDAMAARGWVRTYGKYILGAPDLAIFTTSEEAVAMRDMFTDFLEYLLDSGAKFAAGEKVQCGDRSLRLRTPTADEYFLENPGPLFVAEIISE